MEVYDVDPYPIGWYFVAFSDEVAPRSLVRVHYFGQELVPYAPGGGRVAGQHGPRHRVNRLPVGLSCHGLLQAAEHLPGVRRFHSRADGRIEQRLFDAPPAVVFDAVTNG